MEICRQDPAQEDLRARGAREAQPVQEGLLGQVTLLIPTPNCGQLVFFFRVHANEVKKTEAKTTGKKGAPCKRLPKVIFFWISLLKLVLAGSQGGSPGVHKGQRASGD